MQTVTRHNQKTHPHSGNNAHAGVVDPKVNVRGCSFAELSARSQTETTVLRKIMGHPTSDHIRR